MGIINDYLAELAILRNEVKLFEWVNRGDKDGCLLMLDSLKDKCNRKMLLQYIKSNLLPFMSKFEFDEFKWESMKLGYEVGTLYCNWVTPEERRLSDIEFIESSKRWNEMGLGSDRRLT